MIIDVKEFIDAVDPDKLKEMYKADIINDKEKYNRIKAELFEEYKKIKESKKAGKC